MLGLLIFSRALGGHGISESRVDRTISFEPWNYSREHG